MTDKLRAPIPPWKRGAQITTLAELKAAVAAKRAVIVNHRSFARPMPAIWVFNQTAMVVHNQIQAGMWIYNKDGKEPC